MGASSQGGQMNPQGAQIRPQGQQQKPMGGQGKGPGLPMPQQGGDRPFQSQPYQPIGVNNPPFNPNPVQPTPGNVPQGKGPTAPPQQFDPRQSSADPNSAYMQQAGQMTPQMLNELKMQQMQQQMQMINPQQLQNYKQYGDPYYGQSQKTMTPAEMGMSGLSQPQTQPMGPGAPMQQQAMPMNPMMQRQPMQGQPMAGGKGPMR